MTVFALGLDPYIRDWADLLIRFLHVIAAIGWIGSSFYFVLLDQSLRTPKDPADTDAGVRGELWEVHGGGFYHVQKYQVTPNELPDHLAWFKWEAYVTWLSGFALLVVLFWFDARTYLIDPTVADIGPWTAVGISAGLLLGAWLIYDVLCRILKEQQALLAVLIVAGTAVAAWGTGELFSPRAAWLQVGAMLGTIMAANVFFNIIPAHWELIRAKEAGRDPNPAPGIAAKRRSVHNNYFTLPVLITMLAGHFGFLTGHAHAWIILVALMVLGAWTRHFYNLRHGGTSHWWMVVAAAAVLAAVVVAVRPESSSTSKTSKKSTTTSTASTSRTGTTAASGKELFITSCRGCHTLADADASGRVGPSLDSARPDKDKVIATVTQGKGAMPAFSGQLKKSEIDAVATYVADNAGATGK